tara:strand:- start:1553 stop:2566 length:1014 start_codon:yes stop_codon:yes gene_type:complete
MQTLQVRLTKGLIKKAQELVDKDVYSSKSEVIRDSLRRLVLKDHLKIENKKFLIIYSSDMHGNISQFKKLLARAYEIKANAIIIGGDIAPKDEKYRTIKDQRYFLERKLIPLIDKFNKKNKSRNHLTSIFIIMGNDDFKSNYTILKKYEKVGFKLIHRKIVKLHEDFKIAGYSFVPITPFVNKDWEKLDLIKGNENKTRKGIVLEGKKTKGDNFYKFKFDLDKRSDTIEKDLTNLFKKTDPQRTLLVSHAPPYNTNLDLLSNNEHVGSLAIKKIIQSKQFYLTLHGHIHETVDNSGEFMDKIKNTIGITSGNEHTTKTISIIEFNLYEPQKALRLII